MKRNGFCFLCDKLPQRIAGKADTTMALDTSTSSAVSVILYLKDGTHNAYEKSEYTASKLLRKADGTRPTLKEALDFLQISEYQLSKMLFDYLAGAPKAHKINADNKNQRTTPFSDENNKTTPNYDYTQDSPFIIASMRQTYGLSLQEIKNLHWWEFLALFNALPDECYFSRILQIRTMKIDPKASPERKEEIRKAKKAVALIDTRTPEQKEADRIAQFNALEL
jgi:hypothetical protein